MHLKNDDFNSNLLLKCSRKKLDPLEAYVPAVILTQFQIKDLGNAFLLFISLTAAAFVMLDIARKSLGFWSYLFRTWYHCTICQASNFPC